MAMLEVDYLQKIYTTRFGASQVQALTDVTFSVEKGEYVAIMGESGSGKTTLLNILAALDKPTRGEVRLNGKLLSSISEKALSAFRRDNLGFVFQDFNLLDTFSIRDNIFLPLVLAGCPYREMENRLGPIAQKLGIGGILSKFPYEVSGGQKQRAAVARALITPAPAHSGGRAHRCAGQPCHRQPSAPVWRNQRGRPDHPHGYTLGQGGQPCGTCDVHQGRRGIPPALPRAGRHGGAVPAHQRHPHRHRHGRRPPCVKDSSHGWPSAASAKTAAFTIPIFSPLCSPRP